MRPRVTGTCNFEAAHHPIGLCWSCYGGGDRPCGTCDVCVPRAKGFAEAGMTDPAA